MKRMTAMILMTILLLSASSLSFGDSTISNPGESAERVLSYSVDDHYTVTIPESMPFSGNTASMTITSEGNIESGVQVTITPHNAMIGGFHVLLKDGTNTSAVLHYKLFIGGSESGTEISGTSGTFTMPMNSTQNITAQIISDSNLKYANKGTYSDKLTFTIG